MPNVKFPSSVCDCCPLLCHLALPGGIWLQYLHNYLSSSCRWLLAHLFVSSSSDQRSSAPQPLLAGHVLSACEHLGTYLLEASAASSLLSWTGCPKPDRGVTSPCWRSGIITFLRLLVTVLLCSPYQYTSTPQRVLYSNYPCSKLAPSRKTFNSVGSFRELDFNASGSPSQLYVPLCLVSFLFDFLLSGKLHLQCYILISCFYKWITSGSSVLEKKSKPQRRRS